MFFVGNLQLDVYIHVLAGIFDGVVEQVGNGGAKLFGIALYFYAGAVFRFLVVQRAGQQMVPRAGKFDAIADQVSEINFRSETGGVLVTHLACL